MTILLLDASSITVGGVHRNDNLDQLFGVGALAHRGLPPVWGLCGRAFGFPRTAPSAREGCLGHCDTLTGWTFFSGRFRAD